MFIIIIIILYYCIIILTTIIIININFILLLSSIFIVFFIVTLYLQLCSTFTIIVIIIIIMVNNYCICISEPNNFNTLQVPMLCVCACENSTLESYMFRCAGFLVSKINVRVFSFRLYFPLAVRICNCTCV